MTRCLFFVLTHLHFNNLINCYLSCCLHIVASLVCKRESVWLPDTDEVSQFQAETACSNACCLFQRQNLRSTSGCGLWCFCNSISTSARSMFRMSPCPIGRADGTMAEKTSIYYFLIILHCHCIAFESKTGSILWNLNCTIGPITDTDFHSTSFPRNMNISLTKTWWTLKTVLFLRASIKRDSRMGITSIK